MNATALISQISACGARFEVNGETVRVIKPRGAVIPAGLLQAAREAKAEIRKALSQGAPQRPGAANLDECAAIMEYDGKLPRAWAEYLARLVQGPPPGDFQERHWQAVVDGACLFADEWAGRAYALGWSPDELFGLDAVAPAARIDRRGLAFMLANGARVVSIDTSGADILMPGGTRQRFYRTPRNRLPPATLATAAAATDEIGPLAEGQADDQVNRICGARDFATPHVHPVEHRIELTAAGRDRATMHYRGEVIGESREPLFAAARYLLATGLASPEDRIETWRGETISMNEWPKAPISRRAFQTDFRNEFATDYDPLAALKRKVRRLDELAPKWWNSRGKAAADAVRYPAGDSDLDWAGELLRLDQLVIEGFLLKPLKEIILAAGRRFEAGWQSLVAVNASSARGLTRQSSLQPTNRYELFGA